MKKTKFFKSTLSLILAVLMLVTSIPTFAFTAFAGEEVTEYEVSFYGMPDKKGKSALLITQYVKEGETAVLPNAPEEPGYVFNEWVNASGVEVGDPITKDTSFTATYTEIERYTIRVVYKYALDDSHSYPEYVAEYYKGEAVDTTIPIKHLVGYDYVFKPDLTAVADQDYIYTPAEDPDVDDGSLRVISSAIDRDYYFEVDYSGKTKSGYTIRVYLEKAEYGPDGVKYDELEEARKIFNSEEDPSELL